MRWFYDNCNWRRATNGTFCVTSTIHGSQMAVGKDPCETLYKLVVKVREYEGAESEKGWVAIYTQIVRTREEVMRKGKKGREKPNVKWI